MEIKIITDYKKKIDRTDKEKAVIVGVILSRAHNHRTQ